MNYDRRLVVKLVEPRQNPCQQRVFRIRQNHEPYLDGSSRRLRRHQTASDTSPHIDSSGGKIARVSPCFRSLGLCCARRSRGVIAREASRASDMANITLAVVVRENGGKKSAFLVGCTRLALDFPSLLRPVGAQRGVTPNQFVFLLVRQPWIAQKTVPPIPFACVMVITKQFIGHVPC